MRLKSLFAAAAVCSAVQFLSGCSEDVGREDGSGVASNITVSVSQPWDDDLSTRARRFAGQSSVRESAAFDGTIGEERAYLLCDEVDGISVAPACLSLLASGEELSDEATRGVLMTGNTGYGKDADKSGFHTTFLIWGDAASAGTKATRPYSTNLWALDKAFTWTDDAGHDFVALAPADGATYTSPSATGFSYTTPERAANQPDVMAGKASGKRTDDELHFGFEHIMSAVKFKIGNSGFTGGYKITKIELAGIETANSYTHVTGSWGTASATGSVYEEFAFYTADKFNVSITDDAAGTTFIVLPQQVPTGAYAYVTIQEGDDASTAKRIRASLAGTKWQAAHTYTYSISSSNYPSDYELTVEGTPTFSYDGTASVGSFSVKSYKKVNGVASEAVGWDVAGYKLQNSDGTWPSEWAASETTMLSSLGMTTGSGSISGESVSVAVTAQKSEGPQRRQPILRAADRGTKTNLDLSLYKVDNETSCARTTANCYIVRYGGTYKLPLVIGNTIKNGSVWTPDTYAGTDGSGTITVNSQSWDFAYGPQAFMDYNGNKVTSSNYKITNATEAKIVWHDFFDVDDLSELAVIKDLSITTEDGFQFLNFTVDKDLIQQGNAVLAVTDGSKIIWSWHIYVTDLDWTTAQVTLTNYSNIDYIIPIEGLGYVEKINGTKTYPARKMQVKLQQQVSGKETTVEIVQTTYSENGFVFWDNKYEWGRKDAFPGSTSHSAKPTDPGKIFPASAVKRNGNGTTYGQSIQTPETFYAGGDRGSWSGTFYVNAWSAKRTTLENNATTGDKADNSTVIKTIYDPCPPGFHMPPSGAFTGFTSNGSSSGTRNVKGSWNKGWNYYTNSSKTTSVYFPASGRYLSGGLMSYGEQGWNQTSTPCVSDAGGFCYGGYTLSFKSSTTVPIVGNSGAVPFTVRPVAEESTSSMSNGLTTEGYTNGGSGNIDLQ